MDIVEKMKKWDTWDAMVKDLRTYVDEVTKRMKTHNDPSIIRDFYILELIIIPKVKVEFSKEIHELSYHENACVKAYCDVVAEIRKYRNSDKFNDVLEAHPELLDCEKDDIRQDWKKQRAIEIEGNENLVVEDSIEGNENLVVEDSEMEDYLKAKCDELVNCKAKIDQVILQKKNKNEFRWMLSRVRNWLTCQKIIRQAQPNLLAERKKQVQSMMAEDNSCSSTLPKKWGDSSEDKAKDNSCSSTQAKKWDDSSEDNASSDRLVVLRDRLTRRASSTARLGELKTLIGRADSDLRDLSLRRKDVEDELSVVTSKLDLILQSVTQLKSEKSAFEAEYTKLINVDPPSDGLVLSDLL